MKRSEAKETVLVNLLLYNSTPIKTDLLCTLCGIKERELQQAVQDLRMEHIPVCSGDGGYWLWDYKDDSLDHTIRQLKSRIKNQSATIRALEQVQLEGQQEFNLEEREETWREALRNL
jgi:hypothetical protein